MWAGVSISLNGVVAKWSCIFELVNVLTEDDEDTAGVKRNRKRSLETVLAAVAAWKTFIFCDKVQQKRRLQVFLYK